MRPAALLALLILTAGCAGQVEKAPGAGAVDPVRGDINVFAAASLSDAFKAEAAAFESRHSNAHVHTSFGGSATLASQLTQGAPVDVFASADEANMDRVRRAGDLVGEPRDFTRNRLEMVVAAGNPKGIRTMADLADARLAVVLCAPVVPCGKYAGQLLDRAGVKVVPRSLEQDVTAVVGRVRLGEADAGIVYVTDVKSAGASVSGVSIPDDQNVVASYPVAVTRGGSNPTGGRAFADFVLSGAGQDILAKFGFSPL